MTQTSASATLQVIEVSQNSSSQPIHLIIPIANSSAMISKNEDNPKDANQVVNLAKISQIKGISLFVIAEIKLDIR